MINREPEDNIFSALYKILYTNELVAFYSEIIYHIIPFQKNISFKPFRPYIIWMVYMYVQIQIGQKIENIKINDFVPNHV